MRGINRSLENKLAAFKTEREAALGEIGFHGRDLLFVPGIHDEKGKEAQRRWATRAITVLRLEETAKPDTQCEKNVDSFSRS